MSSTPFPIFHTLSGSRAYGINVEGSDTDLKLIFMDSAYELFGIQRYALRKNTLSEFERVYSTMKAADGSKYDLQRLELVQFLRLTAEQNPTVLEILWSPVVAHHNNLGKAVWDTLQTYKQYFLTSNARPRFLGYMRGQRDAAFKSKANDSHVQQIAKFGYIPKFAAHAVRVGMQGLHLMRTGEFDFGMSASTDYIKSVRNGEVDAGDLLFTLNNLDYALAHQETKLPHHVAQDVLDLLDEYCVQWYISYLNEEYGR